jgi:hypothetical protein
MGSVLQAVDGSVLYCQSEHQTEADDSAMRYDYQAV